METEDILFKCRTMCDEHNCTLLYLTYSGSRLYGTSTPTSDIDVAGIFVPSLNDLILSNSITYIKYKSEENSDENLEIKLVSLQNILKKLITKKDTNSIDLLFSYPSGYLYMDNRMRGMFENKKKLFGVGEDLSKFSYIQFAFVQAKRYGIRGNKLHLIKEIIDYMEGLDKYKKLGDIATTIKSMDKEYISIENGKPGYLNIFGKQHMLSITIEEFYERMVVERDSYGKRSENAESCGGTDWKALSHSLRAVYQFQELCEKGTITFPLSQSELLRDIKLGKYSFDDVEKMFNIEYDKVKEFKTENFKGNRNENFIDDFILSFYTLGDIYED